MNSSLFQFDGSNKKRSCRISKSNLKDLRGFLVYDKFHKKIGVVSEIYCDKFDLNPLYIEITPLSQKINESFVYPVDSLRCSKRGLLFLNSDYSSLKEFPFYRLDKLMESEGGNLITYLESLYISGLMFNSKYYKKA